MLGLIQGLTEFLPVSSSGHLVIFQKLFGIEEPELFFDVSLHVGTLAAVIFFFRKDILTILGSLMSIFTRKHPESLSEEPLKDEPLGSGNGHEKNSEEKPKGRWSNEGTRLAAMIVIGSVPTAIIGLLFHEIADRLFSSLFLVGCMLLITGTILWLTLYVSKQGERMVEISPKNALIIGTVQGLAILPGISRAGSTISAALFLGLSREAAARYSFLLSIPAIIGAELLAIKNLEHGFAALNAQVILGTLTAAVTGYLALVFLLYLIRQGRLHLFAPYCWLLGIAVLIFGS